MKILFITHYQDLYGANKSLLNLLMCLKDRNYDIKVLCPSKGEMTQYLNQSQISNISGYPYNGWEYKDWKDVVKFPYRFLRSIATLYKLKNSLKDFDPDLIYSNSSVIWIGKAIARMLKKAHVWHVREFGLKDYGLRMVGGKPLTNLLMNKSEAIISISKAIDKEVLPEVNPKIKHQIYDGVIRTNEIAKKPKKRRDNSKFTFCMAGLLISTKGYEDAIYAMKGISQKYPNTQLLIAGEGMVGEFYEESLHVLAKSLNLQNHVKFLGYVSNIRKLYSDADCLLMCSEAEGLGRVTVEAMAQGVPVIGKDCGGTSEIITEPYNGYLYLDGVEDLQNQMDKMIRSRNYEAMSAGAIQTVRNNFSIENYTDLMERILKEVVNKYEPIS
jgi:glycosyltransferase involved in cell wall biosynthesis